MKKITVFELSFVLLILGCSNDDCVQYELENTVSMKELGFSVDLPTDYIIKENIDVLSLAAVKNSDVSSYFEAYGITVEANDLNYKLDEFYKISLNNDSIDYIKQYDNFTILDKGNLVINDNDTYWSIYSYGEERTRNYHFISNEKTYRVIFISNNDNFDSLSCKFNTIINSMNFF